MRAITFILSVLVLGGCGVLSPSDDREIRIGAIQFFTHPVRVEIPQPVDVGQDFSIRVTTYGNGCTERASDEVRREALAVEITPMVSVPAASQSSVCPGDLRLLEHVVRLRFEQRGTATITLRGRVEPSGSIIMEQFKLTVQ